MHGDGDNIGTDEALLRRENALRWMTFEKWNAFTDARGKPVRQY